MRRNAFIITIILVFFSFPVLHSQETNDTIEKELVLITQEERISYSLGITIGSNITRQGIESIDYKIFMRALKDAMEGKDLIISPKQAQNVIKNYVQELNNKKYKEKIKEERKFLNKNAQKKEIQVLPSGLQYKVLESGSGPKPRLTDKVTINYHLTLRNGDIIQSTVENGDPVSTRVNEEIKGLTEALMHMKVGAKWKLFIPYDLAYGKAGTDKVPPYSTIICALELRSID